MNNHNQAFWEMLEELISQNTIVVDRPKGSTHPRFADTVYPLDYGYLSGTKTSDGEGLDVWLGSDSSLGLVGVVLSVDVDKKDVEVKLLLGCTDPELEEILNFMNTGSMRATKYLRKELQYEAGT